jgi:outer membrane protein assembly factor BamB
MPFREVLELKDGEMRTVKAVMRPVYFAQRRLKWRKNFAAAIASRPLIASDVIVVLTKKGVLAGINRFGQQLWTFIPGKVFQSSPAADEKSVYLVALDGTLFAVDKTSGKLTWTLLLEGPLLVGSAPLVLNGNVYVATAYGAIYAISPEGKEIWKNNLDEGVFGSPAWFDDKLFVATDRAAVHALDLKDGDKSWKFKTDSRIFASSPKVFRDTLYVGCYSGSLYAIKAANGDSKWKKPFSAGKPILSSPVFFNNLVIIATEGGDFIAINSDTADEAWRFNAGGGAIMDPDQSMERLFVANGRNIISMNILSGKVEWREGFTSDITTSATVFGDEVLFGLASGDVVSLLPR